MKLKLWIMLLITLVLLLNCDKNEIKIIQLKDAIFRAEGNNPTWKLEIDLNNGIHFYSNSELENIITPSSKIIEIMDVATTSYHANTEAANIKVEIFKKQCIDSKEHKEFKYEVKISAKNSGDTVFTTFKGCGNFIADKRLNSKWELQKFNGVELKSDDFMKGLPFVQFDIEKMHIAGNSGCNNFNGKFYFVGRDLLVNKNLASTRMACPNLEFESEFLKALTISSLKYSLKNDVLKLERGNRVFEFKKIN